MQFCAAGDTRLTRPIHVPRPDHDRAVPDIEAVIWCRRPDMLQALTPGNLMVRILHCRSNA